MTNQVFRSAPVLARAPSIQLDTATRSGEVGDASPAVETRVVRKVPEAASPAAETGVARTVRSEAPFRRSPAPRVLAAGVTTMVRLSPRGTVFAARGQDAARVAKAAALIHDLSRLIARDLAQREPTAVHLQGSQNSLLVLRSEVNDIAAAYGPTRRLSALLSKAGLR